MEFIGPAPVLFVGGAAWNCRATGVKNMTKTVATAVLVAAIAATMTAIASPSFAETNAGSPAVTATSHKVKASVQHARPLYNMAPGSAPVNGRDDPAFTGGGSLGYNQMIYSW
jgi:hypothetical protein